MNEEFMKRAEKSDQYKDIINLPHHVSNTHAHMSIYDRAAQFSPFAALTGYDVEIKEAARLTDQRVELDEAEKLLLDEKLQILQEKLEQGYELEFTYYEPDEKKMGGAYVSVRGAVKKIDMYEKRVVLTDGTNIAINELVNIQGDIFGSVDNLY